MFRIQFLYIRYLTLLLFKTPDLEIYRFKHKRNSLSIRQESARLFGNGWTFPLKFNQKIKKNKKKNSLKFYD